MRCFYYKRLLSMVIVTLILLSVSFNPIASASMNQAEGYKKIDEFTMDKINAIGEEEIPVWIWLRKSIDDNSVNDKAYELTGLTDDSILNMRLSKENDISFPDDDNNYDTKNIIKQYISKTKEERSEISEKVNKYLSAKRTIIANLYEEHNTSLIKKVVEEKDAIVYVSKLTPSVIMKLTKEEILEFAKSKDVVSINYFDPSIFSEPPSTENDEHALHIDDVLEDEEFDLQGRNVNVLMNDHNYVRPDVSGYTNIQNPDHFANVFDGNIYQTNNTAVLPTNTLTHANDVAYRLEHYANSANVFVTYNLSATAIADIEWAIVNCNINLINASVNHATPLTYNSSNITKWFDALVNEHHVTLVASAGNEMGWNYGYNAPHVISPACGYNSIAVGAYYTNGDLDDDSAYDFRYSPITGYALPNYKPDLLVPSDSTSYAAPKLSGIVALMMELEPTLKVSPEAVKSILLASCHRKVQSYGEDTQELMETGLTQKQGAGAVDAYRALKIITSGNYETVSAPEDISEYGYNITPSFDDDINVSTSWMIDNSRVDPTAPNSTVMGTVCDLSLNANQNNTLIKQAANQNAGKQVLYLKNASKNQVYNISVGEIGANETPSKFAIAWSERGEHEIDDVAFLGTNAVGYTLTATAKNEDNETLNSDKLNYQWLRSYDNNTWSEITGATTPTYNVTVEDIANYIKCEVTPKDWTELAANIKSVSSSKKSFMYGDANLDGVVSDLDVRLLNRYISFMIGSLDETQLLASDVDLNGSVDIVDVTYIERYLCDMNDLPVV